MKKKFAILPLLLCMVATACIHKSSGAVTPWERVQTYNAAFATSNNTLEQGAEAVVASGLITPTQGAPIIGLTGQVATIHEQVTAILAKGTATTADIASVQALTDQIKAVILALPPSVLGIKNPKSQQTFQADVTSLSTLADAVLSSLKAVLP
jgi:hypothetical protein